MRRRRCSAGRGRSCSKGARPGSTMTSPASPRWRSTRPSPGSRRPTSILLVGTNPRWEAPLVNTRLRKAVRRGAKVFAHRAGGRPRLQGRMARRRPRAARQTAEGSRRRVQGCAAAGADRRRRSACQGRARGRARSWPRRSKLVREGWNGFNVLHLAAARMRAPLTGLRAEGRDVGPIGGQGRAMGCCCRSAPTRSSTDRFGSALKLNIGHHGDKGAPRPRTSILPGSGLHREIGACTSTPKAACSSPTRAVFAPGDAREDWTILRALADALGVNLIGFRQLSTSCARRWSPKCRRSGLRVWADYPGRFAQCSTRRPRRRARSLIRSRGLLPDQRHLPRQPDDAPLLGGTASTA